MIDSENCFDDSDAVDADLAMLEHVLWWRAALHERLVAASSSQDPELADILSSEAARQFAEFFFLIKARGIETAEDVARLAELHSNHLVRLHADRDKALRLGLRRDRLLDAIFTADTLPRLVSAWAERPGTLDQSNLARLLVTVMSTETCRKLVVAAAAAGFLERRRDRTGVVFVRSTGVMERVFGGVMRDLRHRIQSIARNDLP